MEFSSGMGFGQDDFERIACDFRARGGLGPDDLLTAVDIAGAAIGRNNVRTIPRMLTPACVIWVPGPQIYLRANAHDRNFLIAHECGHIALRWAGYAGPRAEEERYASHIAAAIVAPVGAIERAALTARSNRELARLLAISHTSLILRFGEIREEARAVVTKSGHVMKRNLDEDDDTIRGWAKSKTPGVVKVTLTGPLPLDRGRVAIKAG